MSDLRALIEAAKADAPTAAARTKMWTGVSSAIGEAAAATGAAALAGTTSAAKMLVIGALFGGALTVGIGAALLFVAPAHHAQGAAAAAPTTHAAPATHAAPTAPLLKSSQLWAAAEVPRSTPPSNAGNAVTNPGSAPGSDATRAATERSVKAHPAHATKATHALLVDDRDDALAREASLLASARSALSRSDALSALQMVRRLRALPAGQLMPEELAVEAQALRALGLTSDADQVDTTLRTRFPDSVLGR
jgi:hypothetical protein